MIKYTYMYDDPVKVFLEISLNQIDFFYGLPKDVKTEFIFNMRRKTFEEGKLLY